MQLASVHTLSARLASGPSLTEKEAGNGAFPRGLKLAEGMWAFHLPMRRLQVRQHSFDKRYFLSFPRVARSTGTQCDEAAVADGGSGLR